MTRRSYDSSWAIIRCLACTAYQEHHSNASSRVIHDAGRRRIVRTSFLLLLTLLFPFFSLLLYSFRSSQALGLDFSLTALYSNVPFIVLDCYFQFETNIKYILDSNTGTSRTWGASPSLTNDALASRLWTFTFRGVHSRRYWAVFAPLVGSESRGELFIYSAV